MFCHNCGTKAPDGAMFCGGCGAQLAIAQTAEVTPEVEAAPVVDLPDVAVRESYRLGEARAQSYRGLVDDDDDDDDDGDDLVDDDDDLIDDDDFMFKRRRSSQQAGGRAFAVVAIAFIALAAVVGIVWYAKSSEGDGGAIGSSGVVGAYSNTDKTESLHDSRDGKTYKVVKIGGDTWMAENLNYQKSNSWCYGDNSSNCATHGRLYNWYAATNACPSGWHLPDERDWARLIQAAGGAEIAGTALKSRSGWNSNKDGSSGNGSDNLGWSALPSGDRANDGRFSGIGSFCVWWGDTEAENNRAYHTRMTSGSGGMAVRTFPKHAAFSVRCVKN